MIGPIESPFPGIEDLKWAEETEEEFNKAMKIVRKLRMKDIKEECEDTLARIHNRLSKLEIEYTDFNGEFENEEEADRHKNQLLSLLTLSESILAAAASSYEKLLYLEKY